MVLPIAPPTKANPTDKAPAPVLFKDIDNTDIIQESDIQSKDKQNTNDTAVCKIVNTFSCAETDKSPPTGKETVAKTLPDKITGANSCRKPRVDTLEELLTPKAKTIVTSPSTIIENDTQNTPGDNLTENTLPQLRDDEQVINVTTLSIESEAQENAIVTTPINKNGKSPTLSEQEVSSGSTEISLIHSPVLDSSTPQKENVNELPSRDKYPVIGTIELVEKIKQETDTTEGPSAISNDSNWKEIKFESADEDEPVACPVKSKTNSKRKRKHPIVDMGNEITHLREKSLRIGELKKRQKVQVLPNKFRRILPKEQILPNKVTYVAPKIPFRRICPSTDHAISKRHEKPHNTRPEKGPTPCKSFPPNTARHVHSTPNDDHIAPSRVITVDTLKEIVRKEGLHSFMPQPKPKYISRK